MSVQLLTGRKSSSSRGPSEMSQRICQEGCRQQGLMPVLCGNPDRQNGWLVTFFPPASAHTAGSTTTAFMSLFLAHCM